jgi:exonuclease SbcC
LALALGLSDLARGTVRVESLFLDEGFGSLDPDSLDQALSALDGLQADGRQIVVVSHVELLKERVAARIDVTPIGDGLSSVRVLSGA